MTAIDEYRTQIEEIQKRLNGSGDHDDSQIGELKERLNAVRSNLLNKQETIEGQRREIEFLREENEQLSELLGQALAALNDQPSSNLQEIVQNLDSEFSDLLHEGTTDAAVLEEPPPIEHVQDGGLEGAADNQIEAEVQADPGQPGIGDGTWEQPPDDGGQREPSFETGGPAWDPANESPMLKRIMGRRRG